MKMMRRVFLGGATAALLAAGAVGCSNDEPILDPGPTVEVPEASDGGGEPSDGGGEIAEEASEPDVVLEQPESGHENPLLVDPEDKIEEDHHAHDEAPIVEDGLEAAEADTQTQKDTEAVADALKKELEAQPTTSDVVVLTDAEGFFDGFFLGSEVDEPTEVDVYPGTVILAANTGEPGKFVVAGYNAMGDEYVTSDTAFVVNVG